jgi:serine/threonine protein kinase
LRRRFSGQVVQAVNEQLPELAREIYEQTEALPQTETEEQLNTLGYKLTGQCHTGNDAFVVCFKGTKMHLLKALTPKEYPRARALQDRLHGGVHPHLTPFELVSRAAKHFLIMPCYSSTLANVPTLSVEDGRRVVRQVSDAVLFLHGMGFIHMDLKPANICLNEAGDAVLVDLGSVVVRSSPGQPSTSESTAMYVPRDFQPRPRDNPSSNRYMAEDLCDWWMLAMTVAEKVYGVVIGGAAPPPRRQELLGMLRGDFPELAARLTMD